MKRIRKAAVVTLHRRKHSGAYEVGSANADVSEAFGLEGEFYAGFCRRVFEKETGIRLEAGETVHVRINIVREPKKKKRRS